MQLKQVLGKIKRYYFWRDRSTSNHHHYDVGFDTRSKEPLRKELDRKKEQEKT